MLGRLPELVDSSQDMISRRLLLGLLAGLPLAACATRLALNPAVTAEDDLLGWYVGSLPDEPYLIPLVHRRHMSPDVFAQLVPYQGGERPGGVSEISCEGRAVILFRPWLV